MQEYQNVDRILPANTTESMDPFCFDAYLSADSAGIDSIPRSISNLTDVVDEVYLPNITADYIFSSDNITSSNRQLSENTETSGVESPELSVNDRLSLSCLLSFGFIQNLPMSDPSPNTVENHDRSSTPRKRQQHRDLSTTLFISGLCSNVSSASLYKYFSGAIRVTVKPYQTARHLK